MFFNESFTKTISNDKKKWYILDANNYILGRLASKISIILQGKHKSNYKNNIDNGDYIIVINSSKIIFSGNKLNKKKYYRHSGYIGNLKTYILKDLFLKNSNLVLINAVKNMLPRNKLKKIFINKLKVYKYSNHNHISQNPTIIKI
ncbi:50S ribosomal protein L13 [endosymbiont of Euscepes postfasciatus]|uniref:50S ribosomal protein L13 n=1 Tax=endosymbiont of Euscepes postfasciatus TaxID=650377 RepID=UPI000DC6E49F|nr:50S ribosomal protein L13 [endosymbiont of Euscepes postfasciatus]BBA84607.1 50S ribosomal protein L13 [endosymbiont of Euscepes postfasciatus]